MAFIFCSPFGWIFNFNYLGGVFFCNGQVEVVRAVLEMGGITRESAEELEVSFSTLLQISTFPRKQGVIFALLTFRCFYNFFCKS